MASELQDYQGYTINATINRVRDRSFLTLVQTSGADLDVGHFEHIPYDRDSLRSIYHIREYDIFRLSQVRMETTFLPLSFYFWGKLHK